MRKRAEKLTVADFFAGIGLVSMGLKKAGWETIYALDYDRDKATSYTRHFGPGHYYLENISSTKGESVPNVTLAHASFPCTDLSVAGAKKGINHGESSSFWHFVRILAEMKKAFGENRPPLVLLENVEGLLNANSGKDLRSILDSLNSLNYYVDLLRIDASHFVPQSRVRIFIIGIHESIVKKLDMNLLTQGYGLKSSNARSEKIVGYVTKNPDIKWYFHSLPNLPKRELTLEDIIDTEAKWWSRERAEYLYRQMHKHHRDLIEGKRNEKKYYYYPAFRRMRTRDGKPQSTAELRTDGIAGCLRTPKGGSARQILVRVGKGKFDARLINEKEAARLMGAADFKLHPDLSLNQALFGFGDAVCVPAVEWIGKNYLNNLLQ